MNKSYGEFHKCLIFQWYCVDKNIFIVESMFLKSEQVEYQELATKKLINKKNF